MFIYLITFACALFIINFASKNKNNPPIYYGSITIVILLLSYIAGMRDIGVGTDTITYTESYFRNGSAYTGIPEIILEQDLPFDKAYLILNYIGAQITNQTWIALLLTEFIITIFLFWGSTLFFKENKGLTIFIFLYLFIFYNQSLNFMRQMCAVSICYVSIYYSIKRKWIPFSILIFIAYHFHSSAIMGLIVPVIYYICLIKNKRIRNFYLFLSILIGLLFYTSFYYILNIIGGMNSMTEIYADRYGAQSSYSSIGNFPKTKLIIFIFIYILLFISYKKNIIKSVINLYGIVIHSFYILMFLLSNYIVYLYRISFYLYIIDLTLISIILASKQITKPLKYSFYIIIIFSWYYEYILNNSCETYPYSSQILGI